MNRWAHLVLQSGFSLLELIMVIVITGVLGGLVASIGQPLKGYVDATHRADLTDEANTALQRMAGDLHSSLTSVTVSSSGSEYCLDISLSSVRYTCDSAQNELKRHSGFTALPSCGTTPTDGIHPLLAQNVTSCSSLFNSVDVPQATQSATKSILVTLQLELANSGETNPSISLMRQVCVRCPLN